MAVRSCLTRIGRSRAVGWCRAVAVAGVLVAVGGCGGPASSRGAPATGDPGQAFALPHGATLRGALLTGFGDARPIRDFLDGSDAVVIAPVAGNPAGFRKAGLSENPVRDQECRPWLDGLLWTAARNPALGHAAAAAYTMVGGYYVKPTSPPRSRADLPAIWVNEVIVAAPSRGAAERMIPPQSVPVPCQHTVTPAGGPSGRAITWRPAQIRSADAVRAGDQAQADTIVWPGIRRPVFWSEAFRMRNYDIELDVQTGSGIRQPQMVLQRLVRAAYLKADAALLAGCAAGQTAGSSIQGRCGT